MHFIHLNLNLNLNLLEKCERLVTQLTDDFYPEAIHQSMWAYKTNIEIKTRDYISFYFSL